MANKPAKNTIKTSVAKKEKKQNKITVEFRKEEGYEFKSTKIATEFQKNPNLSFTFDPSGADDNNKSLNIVLPEPFPTSIARDCISVVRSGKICSVNAAITFEVIVKGGKTDEDFDDWSENQGGWACAWVEPSDHEFEVADQAGATYLGTKDILGYPLVPTEEELNAKPTEWHY